MTMSDIPILIGRMVDANEALTPNSVKFISKVVSRKHAHLSFHEGKVYVQDSKSSSGTFLNDVRLSPQGVESPKSELKNGDVIRLGEDCEVNGVLHQSICMRVVLPTPAQEVKVDKSVLNINEIATDTHSVAESQDDQYVDALEDAQVQIEIENELNDIWNNLSQGLDNHIRRLKAIAKVHANTMITQGFYSGYAVPELSSQMSGSRQSMMPMSSSDHSLDTVGSMKNRGSKMGGSGLNAAIAMYGGSTRVRNASALSSNSIGSASNLSSKPISSKQ